MAATTSAQYALSRARCGPRRLSGGRSAGLGAAWLLPLLLKNRFQVPARPFRAAIWLVLMIGFGSLFLGSEKFYAAKNLAVGRGNDRIIAFGPQ